MSPNLLVLTTVSAAVVNLIALRAIRSSHDRETLAATMYAALVVGAWYTNLPLADRALFMAVHALLAAWYARAAYRSRPKPLWWNGQHERISGA